MAAIDRTEADIRALVEHEFHWDEDVRVSIIPAGDVYEITINVAEPPYFEITFDVPKTAVTLVRGEWPGIMSEFGRTPDREEPA